MRRIFADSLYWIALSHQRDQWHAAALKASRALQSVEIVTTQEMLTDCISMEAMRQESITEILTHDNHFKQEGFAILL
jgi:predicted nucleic acid-binding protein